MNSNIRKQQESICFRFGAEICECIPQQKVGISNRVRLGMLPLQGMRMKPGDGLTGWFIWAGEWSDDPEFLLPLHAEHLPEWCPSAIPYLLLPPGWRFQVAPDHEDVWFDPSITT